MQVIPEASNSFSSCASSAAIHLHKILESKYTQCEQIWHTGRSAQSAARNVEGASNSLAEATATQMRDLEKRLAKDLQQDLQSKLVVPLEGLASFEARLQVGREAILIKACIPYVSHALRIEALDLIYVFVLCLLGHQQPPARLGGRAGQKAQSPGFRHSRRPGGAE